MYFYSYEVFYYDNIAEKDCTAIGLVAGESYDDVISKISGYYGDEDIDRIKIEIISEGRISLCDSSNDNAGEFAAVENLIARIKEKVIW